MSQIAKSLPTLGSVHIDRPLTNISILYMQDEKEFIGDIVFPKIPTTKESNMYFTFKKEYFFRDQAKLRAPGTKSAGGGVKSDTETFVCEVYAYHFPISDRVRRNMDEGYNLDAVATINVTRALLIRKEVEFSKTAFDKNKWAKSVSGTTEALVGPNKFVNWDDYVNSDPIKDIRELRMEVKESTGYAPNTLILPEKAYEVVRMHPKVRDVYKYTTDQVVTEDMLAKVFGLDKLYISGAVLSTSEEGIDSVEDYEWINKNSALLYYNTKNPGLMTVTAAYQFSLTTVGGGNGDVVIKNIRDERIESDLIEGQIGFTYKVVCKDLGLVLENVLSE